MSYGYGLKKVVRYRAMLELAFHGIRYYLYIIKKVRYAQRGTKKKQLLL